MIALSHKTRFSHVVYLSKPEQADTLFERAKPGDTLHNVGDFREDEVEPLMNQIGSQLQEGKFTRL